jgi:hypothetical protein
LADEGLFTLREAAALAEETGERFVEAEIHRVEGNLRLAESGLTEAEACCMRVICGGCKWRGRRRRTRSNCVPPAT